MNDNLKSAFAELIETFTLVLIGAGSAALLFDRVFMDTKTGTKTSKR